MKALLERLKIDSAAEKRRTSEDRAINGLNGGYTIEQAGRLCALLLRGGAEDGRQRIAGTDLYLLRTRLDFLMLHAMMLRGESTRKAELADLCSVLLPDERDLATLCDLEDSIVVATTTFLRAWLACIDYCLEIKRGLFRTERRTSSGFAVHPDVRQTPRRV